MCAALEYKELYYENPVVHRGSKNRFLNELEHAVRLNIRPVVLFNVTICSLLGQLIDSGYCFLNTKLT
jgi:hypothetical protein